MNNIQDIITNFEQSIVPQFTQYELAMIENSQKSEEWHEERRGKFTGSRLKDLMSCSSRAKNKSWDNLTWLKDFGDTALTYVIERAIERATGERIQTPETWQMRWGNLHEQDNIDMLSERLGEEITKCGFLHITPTCGASPDGLCDALDAIIEVKSPATVMSHYNLSNEPVVEGHEYFWQVTGEMMAAKRQRAIFNSYDNRYPIESRCNYQFVDLSAIHANAIMFRVAVGEHLVNIIMQNEFKIPRSDLRGHIDLFCSDCPFDYDGIIRWIETKLNTTLNY